MTAPPRSGGFRRLRFLGRNRYQLIGATLVAILLPATLRTEFEPWPQVQANMQNSIVGTFVAMLFGAYLLRRMTAYPGVRSISFLLPVFGVSYGASALFFFLSRLEYSRFQFVSSVVLAVLWFGVVGVIEPRIRRQRLAVLPFGNTDQLLSLTEAEWIPICSANHLPDKVTGVVADLRADMPPPWERFIARASLAGMPVYHSKQIVETFTGQVQIEHLSENTFGSLLPSLVYLRFKRLLDVAGSLALLPLVIPLFMLVALAIWMEDHGSVLFHQQRIGYRGRPFRIWKFRTMREGGTDGAHFTKPNDSRITRVGRFLRHYRIDELPQIFNILRGEMSWIGPRPEAIKLAEWYESEIPFYGYRHIVRPGITGWAQVNQGNVAEIKAATDKLHYDFFYIKHFSPWLDLLIAAKTVQIVLRGFGSR